jgi:hypothetical protein
MIDEDKVIQLVEKNHFREWHGRYGHLPLKAFSRIPEAPPDLINANLHCDACEKGKSTKSNSSAQKEPVRTEASLERIYADLVGPMGTETYNGKKYLLNVMDDNTRITFVAGLRKKSDAATALIGIIEAAERQFETCVKFLQTDQGGGFRSEELQQLRSRGIIQKETVPRHSETNPQIERGNLTIVTMARTALLASGLPKKLWLEAARHAAYTKNHCQTQLSEVKCHLSYLRKQKSRRNENFSKHLEKEYMHMF